MFGTVTETLENAGNLTDEGKNGNVSCDNIQELCMRCDVKFQIQL